MTTPTSLGAAPPDPVPATVEGIAARLREDPVLVATMMGNGATAEVDAALTAKAEQSSFPVYVVLTRTPVGLDPVVADEELASLLHAEIGGDGVYVVQSSLGYGHLGLWGDLVPGDDQDEVLLSLARYQAREEIEGVIADRWGSEARPGPAVEAGAVLDVLSRPTLPDYEGPILTDDELASYTTPAWRTYGYQSVTGPDGEDPITPGSSALLATATGVAVALTAFRLLRVRGAAAVPRARRDRDTREPRSSGWLPPQTPPPSLLPPPPKPIELPDTALLMARLDHDLERTTTAKVGHVRVDLALRCRDVARAVLADHRDPGPDDLLDLLGVQALLETGLHALSSKADDWEPYRGCWFDPRHGRARGEAVVADGLTVPACSACRRRAKKDRPAEPLIDPRTDRAYYEGDTVWATTGFGTLTDDLPADVAAARTARKPAPAARTGRGGLLASLGRALRSWWRSR